ncbi:MAG: sulfite exporter TauE/SafE family protein [Acidimicrobiaceae bacterium]|nr:sulfite exporter TauE/SafE family protein [Acidimicrobiaceae bacterium]
MHLDILLVLASAVVGLLVGLTGTGGGALMTPMLVLIFGVAPSAAIASDLLAALFMKPLGVAIHWRRRSVNTELVKFLSFGSVPAAFLGTFTMRMIGHSSNAEHELQVLLGCALIVGSLAMLSRTLFIESPHGGSDTVDVRPIRTVVIGAIGGFMVGLTSVGAGSLILVLLLVLYPRLRNDQLVGTDLAQSIPLTLSATIGTMMFSHVNLSLTSSIIVGSVPAVVIGSIISSKSNGYLLRRLITGVVLLSGIKYVGASPDVLGLSALATVLILVWLSARQHRRAGRSDARRSVPEAVEDVVTPLPSGFD